ncbi:hypothetical protein PanWU01x14_000860 [Parasponia andersonii]|uniref:Uncharacterized protein n=1 Tax=Parasponia andersonii TaxID=3476 RepID=A0A2P5E4W3_PARAD|nr:hypothetical protein PanWU01x14_000860 [Parasponia andersonii]
MAQSLIRSTRRDVVRASSLPSPATAKIRFMSRESALNFYSSVVMVACKACMSGSSSSSPPRHPPLSLLAMSPGTPMR